ncbi:alpha/beta hydrolase family protein [Amycolatopsis sp. NPDC004368]
MTTVLPAAPPELALAAPAGPPPATGWPIVVFVSGGAPGHAALGRHLGARLPAAGFAVAQVHSGQDGRPPRPAVVRAAVRRLHRHHDLDPHRIAAWGHGAGGLLAVLLAVDHRDTRVQAAVAWSAPSDLTRLPPATPSDAPSPLPRITANAAPLLVVHGTADDTVPISHGETLVSTYWLEGADAEFHWLDDAGHAYGLRDRDAMTALGVAFLRRRLGAQENPGTEPTN